MTLVEQTGTLFRGYCNRFEATVSHSQRRFSGWCRPSSPTKSRHIVNWLFDCHSPSITRSAVRRSRTSPNNHSDEGVTFPARSLFHEDPDVYLSICYLHCYSVLFRVCKHICTAFDLCNSIISSLQSLYNTEPSALDDASMPSGMLVLWVCQLCDHSSSTRISTITAAAIPHVLLELSDRSFRTSVIALNHCQHVSLGLQESLPQMFYRSALTVSL